VSKTALSLRERRRETTRREAVDSLLGLIAEGGIDLVTIDLVAERSGMARGTLYAHFPAGRDELLRAASSPEWELIMDGDTGWAREMGVTVSEFDGGYVRFHAETSEKAGVVLQAAQQRGVVESFGPVHHSLHEIFKESLV